MTGENVVSFEYLIAVDTKKSVPGLGDDEMRLTFENQITGEKRTEIIKKDQMQNNQNFRLKPQ